MTRRVLSRRSFAKLSAATALAGATLTNAPAAFADTEPVPSPEKDVKRIRTCCRGCGKMECGVWVTVEDGRAVKVEGDTSCFLGRQLLR